MLYELVTGQQPFTGDTPTAVISQHLNTAPVAPSWHTEHCPPALEDLILALLAKEPEQRPASARGGARDPRGHRPDRALAVALRLRRQPARPPRERRVRRARAGAGAAARGARRRAGGTRLARDAGRRAGHRQDAHHAGARDLRAHARREGALGPRQRGGRARRRTGPGCRRRAPTATRPRTRHAAASTSPTRSSSSASSWPARPLPQPARAHGR